MNNTIPFWINDPLILFNREYIFNLWPLQDLDENEKLNSITRLIILLSIIGTIITKNINIIISSLVCISVIIIFHLYKKRDSSLIKENFTNDDIYNKLSHNFTNPNNQNPLMNVQLTEIQDNPEREEAAPSYNKNVEKKINDTTKEFIKKSFNNEINTDEKLFDSLGDKFEFEQSMRQFYTTPNTRIANNQKAFAKFCYGNMASCKDGDIEQCIKNNPHHQNI